MVKVIGYQARKTEQGKEFFALTVQSGVEIVQSQRGGVYATAKKASLPCSFDEETCKTLIGCEIPGTISKVEVEPYQYITEEGEAIMRNHRYEYQLEDLIKGDSLPGFKDVAKPSTNGHFVPSL